MNKITIVWQRPKNATWETDWIHWLFSDITDNIVDNLDHSLYLDNSVLIDCLVWAPYHNNYAREMRRRGLRFGLVHLTDEGSDNDISSYTDCDFVIRMFMRKCIQDYVLTIPIGYTSGTAMTGPDRSTYERKFDWSCIIERFDHSRAELRQIFSDLPNGMFYQHDHHNPRLSTDKMSDIYRNSNFVPCPNGRVTPESFRVFEALENGAIPIVLKTDYWYENYGIDFPAIQVKDWHEAKEKIKTMLKNPEVVEKYRQHCIDWWTESKRKTKSQVEQLVEKTIFNKGK